MMFLKNYDEITENVMVESINVINKYFQTNKCCELHPSCSHPKEQTDIILFNNNNKSIQILKNTFYDSVKLYLKKGAFCILLDIFYFLGCNIYCLFFFFERVGLPLVIRPCGETEGLPPLVLPSPPPCG